MPSLGEDISSLRKKEKLSIQDIFDSTRIPQNVLREIESGNIFKDKSRNKTYVRSFVRTYAKVLKIEEDDIIQALDETEESKYSGSIAKKYGLAPKDASKEESDKKYEPKFRLGEELAEDDNKTSDLPGDKETSSAAEEPATTEEKEEIPATREVKTPEPKKGPTFSQPDPTKEHNKLTPEPPTVDKVNWVDMGKKVNSPGNRSATPLIAVLIAAILIVAGYFTFRFFTNRNSQPESAKQDGISMDTVASVPVTGSIAADSAKKETQIITANQPDTLYLTIYAAKDRLDPVRVSSDVIKQLNPYWIEKGQAMRFEFIKNISIRGQFSRMMLMLNGHPIPNIRQYEGQDQMLHITRSIFENDPKWMSPAPDSLGDGIAKPDSIINRPVFN